MTKVNRTSMAVNDERLKQLMDLFPEAIAEGKIDFDKLRQALDEHIDSRPERYSFAWAGKRDAMQAAQIPSRATLVPDREASVNFDETQNVFIEGDNLEVLKLLARPYFGRVKMIYIDPPYNTGGDFIYPDDYADPLDAYLHLTGQKNGNGDLLTTNAETNGRYHSSWLSMMYPRLILCRQMMRDDGVIFVSVDDREFHNLRFLLNEIFGENNFLGTILWKKKTNGNNMGYIPPVHDYFVVYGKQASDDSLLGFPLDDEYIQSTYTNPDNDPRGPWTTQDLSANHKGPWFPIKNPNTGETYYPPEGRYWVFSEEDVQKRIKEGRIIFGKTGKASPVQKVFLHERDSLRKKAESWWDAHGLNEDGTEEIGRLLTKKIFDHPKPSVTLKHLCNISTQNDDIVLDFFAGSGTTAQAVMELNKEDNGNRRFILVQLPEPTKPDSVAREAGYNTISQIAIERIRRVIGELEEADAELGFRVFRLTESNYSPDPDPEALSEEAYAEQLALWADSLLVDGWDATDVIYEVALKEGYGLNIRVEEVSVENNTVYHVTDPDKEQSFYICLDETLRTDIIDALGLTPDDLFICHDKALDDTLAANLALQARLQTL